MSLITRLLNMLRRRRLNDEIRLEQETHLALLEEEEEAARGLKAGDARALALRRFGNTTLTREKTRDNDLLGWLDAAGRDLHYAARVLRKSPTFSVFSVLAIALGVGSTSLMFSILNSLVLQPPPFPDSNRLFMVWRSIPQSERVSFSPREFLAWQGQSRVFEKLAAFTGTSFAISGRGEPEQAFGQMVTPSFFHVLGVNAAAGRTFLDSEGEAGHDRVVVFSHSLWQEKFQGRLDMIGQSIMMSGDAYTVIGVMPEGFDFPGRQYRLWVPTALRTSIFATHPDAHFLRVIGRTRPGVTQSSIDSELTALPKRLDAADQEPGRRYYTLTLSDAMNGELRRPMVVMLLAVAFLLLIACANVANLMLARASVRQREMAVRGALGASRFRLMFQLLMESALLSFAGGAIGLVLAMGGLRFLIAFGSQSVPQLVHAGIDVWAVSFACVISAGSGILTGFAPALSISRTDAATSLKEGTRSTQSASTNRTRSVLMFAEVALATVLVVSCTLMIRSFRLLASVNPGFQPERVLVTETVLRDKTYPQGSDMLKFYRVTLAHIRALPGVQGAGMITHLPFGGNDWGNSYEVEGQPAPPGKDYSAQIRPISPGYFAAMGIPLHQGRDFSETDSEKAPGVAIVNEFLAHRFWPNADPLGKRIRFGTNWLTIVGVCGNIKHVSLDSASDPEIYAPYPQLSPELLNFLGRANYYVVRASTPSSMASALRVTIHSVDPEMVVKVNPMDRLIDDSIAEPRFRTWLITSFSMAALALACLGIYGVVSYVVSQRHREIGLRIALGARHGDILREVLWRAVRLAAAGVGAGLAASLFLSRFLGNLLFGITALDPITYVSAGVLLVGVALLASYLPASRAARIDPMVSLRYE